jgi:hypothetical protein
MMTKWNQVDASRLANHCMAALGATLAQKVAQAAFGVKPVVVSAW